MMAMKAMESIDYLLLIRLAYGDPNVFHATRR